MYEKNLLFLLFILTKTVAFQLARINKNLKNPFLRKVLLSEPLMLLVLILLVSELPASLTTNIIIPCQGLFLIKEKPAAL